MSQHIIDSNNQNIILTTGIYDLVKDHIRRKRVTPLEEQILTHQLKRAQQVTRRNLPPDIVTIDSRVTIRDHSDKQDKSFVFVAPDKARKKNGTESILSKVGLALVGCRAGDIIHWVFGEEEKQLEVLKVERLG